MLRNEMGISQLERNSGNVFKCNPTNNKWLFVIIINDSINIIVIIIFFYSLVFFIILTIEAAINPSDRAKKGML